WRGAIDPASAAIALSAMPRAAARWQLSLEALTWFERALAQPGPAPGTAALAFGLASSLRSEVDHAIVRRISVVAGALSRWNLVVGTEANAGEETLYLEDSPDAGTFIGALRQAVLSPPWPARNGRILFADHPVVVDNVFPAATRLEAQVLCADWRAA